MKSKAYSIKISRVRLSKSGGITDQRYPSPSFVIRNPATYPQTSATCRHLLLSLISLHHRPTFRSFDVDTSLPRTKQNNFASKHYSSQHWTRRFSKEHSFKSSFFLAIAAFFFSCQQRYYASSLTSLSRIRFPPPKLEYFAPTCIRFSPAF